MKLERYAEAQKYYSESLKTGLFFFDDYDAFCTDDVLVIGGGTGTGKTFLAMYMAMNIAKAGKKVLYINGEVLASIFVKRMEALDFSFEKDFGPFDEFKNNRFRVVHREDFEKKFTFDQIENWVKLIKPDLLVIDLFSCILPNGGHIPTITGEYSEAFSFYPKKYNCAIIMTEQLTKDRVINSRPTEVDISQGAALTNKPSKVLTLYRYYKQNPTKSVRGESETVKHTLEVIVHKDRSDKMDVGIKYVHFDGYRKLTPVEREEYIDLVFPKIRSKENE